MSFVEMALKIQFQSLVSDYLEALEKNKQLNQDARKIFNRDPVAALSDDVQKSLDLSLYEVYIARSNLFNFVLENKDNIQILEPPDAEARKCV